MRQPRISAQGNDIVLMQESKGGTQRICINRDDVDDLVERLQQAKHGSQPAPHADVPTGLEAEEARQDAFGEL